MITILLVDDSNIFSRGLELLLNQEEDMEVVGIIRSFTKAGVMENRPNIILVNTEEKEQVLAKMPSGLLESFPESKIIYVLSFADPKTILQGINTGVTGFIQNKDEPQYIVNAIRSIYYNHYVISGDIAKKILNEVQHTLQDEKETLHQKLKEEGIYPLRRYVDVLYFIYKGKTNAEIAKELQLTEKSVRDYVSKAYKTIEIYNRKKVQQFLVDIMTAEESYKE